MFELGRLSLNWNESSTVDSSAIVFCVPDLKRCIREQCKVIDKIVGLAKFELSASIL